MNNKTPYAVVVGGSNMDIGGISLSPLKARDSNPGKISLSAGGVGRNIAHNLALLGAKVYLLSAVGDDINAEYILDSTGRSGTDTSHILRVQGLASGTYIYICAGDGEMELALNDMSVCEKIDTEYLEENLSLIQEASLIIIDTNIPREAIEYLTNKARGKIMVDPVSAIKAKKLIPYLHKIHMLKPNLLEAQELSGVKITDEKTLEEAAKALLDKGPEEVYVSLGEDGMLAAVKADRAKDAENEIPDAMSDEKEFEISESDLDYKKGNTALWCKESTLSSGEKYMIKIYPRTEASEVRNSTGAGDAFMAAMAYSHMQGFVTDESVLFSLAAAALAVECKETINPMMSEENVKNKMRQGSFREK